MCMDYVGLTNTWTQKTWKHDNQSHLITTKESQDGGTGKVLDEEDGGAHDGEGGHVQQEGHRQRHLGHAHKHVWDQKCWLIHTQGSP